MLVVVDANVFNFTREIKLVHVIIVFLLITNIWYLALINNSCMKRLKNDVLEIFLLRDDYVSYCLKVSNVAGDHFFTP